MRVNPCDLLKARWNELKYEPCREQDPKYWEVVDSFRNAFLAASTCPKPAGAEAAFNRVVLENNADIEFSPGTTVTVTVSRTGGTPVTKKFINPAVGEWRTTYGLSAVQNRDDAYFSSANPDGTFTITAGTPARSADVIPTVMFSWVPAYCFGSTICIAPSAAIWLKDNEPLVMAGASWVIAHNVLITAGVAGTNVKRLSAEYEEGQVIKENLSSDKLMSDAFQPAAFVALTIRFDKSPFSSKKSGSDAKKDPAANQGAGNAPTGGSTGTPTGPAPSKQK